MPLTGIFRMFGVVACTAALHSGASAQGLVTQKNIPLSMAKTIAEAAMEKCNALGFRVSVVVVGRAGLPLVMLRGDGAGLHTPEEQTERPTPRAPSVPHLLSSFSAC